MDVVLGSVSSLAGWVPGSVPCATLSTANQSSPASSSPELLLSSALPLALSQGLFLPFPSLSRGDLSLSRDAKSWSLNLSFEDLLLDRSLLLSLELCRLLWWLRLRLRLLERDRWRWRFSRDLERVLLLRSRDMERDRCLRCSLDLDLLGFLLCDRDLLSFSVLLSPFLLFVSGVLGFSSPASQLQLSLILQASL